MSVKPFRLDDRYTLREGRVALTGIQALVRLPLDQNRRDREAGLRVGTYVSGYQGSPLGELDKQLRLAGGLLKEHDVVFQAGINEDVAATAIYGAQLLKRFPHDRFDGVLGLWYGKAPGVDRTGDAFRHGQFLGTSPHGGALALAGDDPACKSSTLPSDSTPMLHDLFFPVLYPADPAEVLEYGLHGIALSRYSGLWSALKIVTNVADGGSVVSVHPELGRPRIPELIIEGTPFQHIQDMRLLPPYSVEMERRIYTERLLAVQAYARHNHLDRVVVRGSQDRLGLVAAGKTFLDLMQALDMLGLETQTLNAMGIRIYKPALIAPMEVEALKEFALGLAEVVVVEEKRGGIETQIRDRLYNLPQRPAVFGKQDEQGRPLFPMHGEMGADTIAGLLAEFLARRLNRPELRERVRPQKDIAKRGYEPVLPRSPYFCSGCPHNTSTTLPLGESSGGGIGCHAMAAYMDRGITWLTHMGGEGAPWLGLAPFTEKTHTFQNVGDGTYYHSASKALEACISGGVNMTFKLLYNAAVAMTGGQSVVGARSPLELAKKLTAEGAREVVIVAEQPERYHRKALGGRISLAPKTEYAAVMNRLKEVPGVTVIIFDQQCAAEKRRMRKRGLLAVPPRRVFINPAVCEGCGDCGVKSNCLSVVPVETPFGRKTQIHQSSCNMDYSCLKGDCPAFMSVELGAGANPVKRRGLAGSLEAELPEPLDKRDCRRPFAAMLVGIGGTGVVTVDALLVTAAAMEGKHVVHLDQTGLSQKGGAVVSNLIISQEPMRRANKISVGETDLLLGFDLLASVAPDNLDRYHPSRTQAIVNTARTSTAATVTNVKVSLPLLSTLTARLDGYTRKERNRYLDVEEVVEALFGDHMAANLFLVGVAYQAGALPLEAASIEEALRLNNVAVAQNLNAFRWGRRWVHEPDAVQAMLNQEHPHPTAPEEAHARVQRYAPGLLGAYEALVKRFPSGEALSELLHRRVAELLLYQGPPLAARYLDFVGQVAQAEQQRAPGRTALREAAARGLFKLLAVKDEYEVARLWLQDETWAHARSLYQGPLRRYVHLHPPFLRRLGMTRKLRFGFSAMLLFRMLHAMRFLRGTWLDPFNRAAHRRWERGLEGGYTAMMLGLLPRLNLENHGVAVSLAALPEGLRGYESIKERNGRDMEAEAKRLLAAYQHPETVSAAGD